MNLTSLKSVGTNDVLASGALNGNMMSIKIVPQEGLVAPDTNDLIISVGDRNAILLSDKAQIRNYVYHLSKPLCYEEYYGEFCQRAEIIDNEIQMRAYVEWTDGDGKTTIEELEPLDILMFSGANTVYTNYQNVEIEIYYPQVNSDLCRMFLNTSIYNSHKKANKSLTMNDLYFKDSFTKTGNEINEEIDNLNVKCITSKNNKFSLDSDGNLTVNSITTNSSTDSNFDNNKIRDFIYPIGSIYMSVNNVNPTTLFGGTWVQMKDKFLLGAGDTYENGNIGGEATHTLTTTELPSHSHGIPSLSGSTGNAGAHNHAVIGTSATNGGSGVFCETWANRSNDRNGYTSSVGDHSHSVTTNASTTNNTGSGASHNNMPPYLVVNMWKRTA